MVKANRNRLILQQTKRAKFQIHKKGRALDKRRNKELKHRKQIGMLKRRKKELPIPNNRAKREKMLRLAMARRNMQMEGAAQKLDVKSLLRQSAGIVRAEMLMKASSDSRNFKEPVKSNVREVGKRDTKQHYRRELNKLIDACDVVVEVLDARDPLGCRCKEMETRVAGMKAAKVDSSKKLVFLLNKIDLIPPDVLSKWVRYLRREYPVIAFKASTQGQKRNLSRKNTYLKTMTTNPDTYKATAKCVGADALLGLLKNYCRSQDIKTTISVGFVGYPNVGKSSIINSLKRNRAVGTSATPGFTQSLQEVKLDKNLYLIDSPGVILNEGDDDASLVLKNCVKLQEVDAIEAVNKIVSRINPVHMMQFYGIPAFNDGDGLLFQVAKAKGRMKQGGIPDMKVAARLVLQDWNSGKIKYYQEPPEMKDSVEEAEPTFVQEWGKELDIDNIINVNVEKASMEIEMTTNLKNYVPLSSSRAEKMDVEH